MSEFHNDHSFCWIYIYREKEKSGLQIAYTLDFPAWIRDSDNSDIRLIYFRRFDNILDGIAHKLFLEQMSVVSLRRFIRIYNPREEDLKINEEIKY